MKQRSLTVYFVVHDPRTPLLVRLPALLTAAYALSPIDLIPDFIPVIGYLDDLLLIPLGVALVVRLTLLTVIEAALEKAAHAGMLPVNHAADVVIVLVWLIAILIGAGWILRTAAN